MKLNKLTSAAATRNGNCTKILAGISLASLLTPCLSATIDPQAPAELAPYTVSANRFEQPINEVPASVTLITQEDIAKSGAVSLTQVLREKANFAYSSFSSPAQATLDARGLSDTRHTLVIVDGRVVTRPDLGQFNWSQFPLENIESVEVIKGSNVALYGDRASGSVIKITTKRGSETPQGSIEASYGSYDTENARLSYTGKRDKLGYAVRSEYLSSDLYRDHSEMLNKSAGLGLDYTLTPSVTAFANVDYLKSDYQMPGNLTKAQFEATPRASLAGRGQGDESYLNLGGGVSAKDTEYGTFDLNTGLVRRNLDFQGFLIENRDLDTYTVSPSWLYSSEDWNLLLGLDFVRDDMTVKNPTGTLDDDFKRDRYGFFGQINREINNSWVLSATARHEKAKIDFKDKVNTVSFSKSNTEQAYGAGATYLFSQTLRLWGRYEHFYRYPMVDEIIASGFGFGAATPNPTLNPETGNTVEIGGDYSTGNWKLSANLFGTRMKDEVFFNALVFRNTNFAEKTLRYGFDSSADYDESRWGTGLSYRYVTAEEDSGANKGQRIASVPNHNLQARLTVRPIEKLEVSGFARYRGSFDSDAGGLGSQRGNALLVNIGAATVFDLRARYQILESLEGFASVENLTDKNYTNNVIFGAYYPETGRTVNGGLRYRF